MVLVMVSLTGAATGSMDAPSVVVIVAALSAGLTINGNGIATSTSIRLN